MDANTKNLAEFARLALRFRLLAPASIVAWDDALVADRDVPEPWFIDLALAKPSDRSPASSSHDLKSLEFSSQAFRGAVDRRDTDHQPIVESDRQRRKRVPARSVGPE
jgi:hypothetical protein